MHNSSLLLVVFYGFLPSLPRGLVSPRRVFPHRRRRFRRRRLSRGVHAPFFFFSKKSFAAFLSAHNTTATTTTLHTHTHTRASVRAAIHFFSGARVAALFRCRRGWSGRCLSLLPHHTRKKAVHQGGFALLLLKIKTERSCFFTLSAAVQFVQQQHSV
jgi:hypothetical protein